MKRLLFSLLFVAPAMVAMEQKPEKPTNEHTEAQFTKAQKERLLSALIECDMTPEDKETIINKLVNDEPFSEDDIKLLIAYDLLPTEETKTAMNFSDLIGRFIDIQALGMGIASCSLSTTGIKQPKKTEILKVVIKALLINDLEVEIRESISTLGEFFDQKKLKKALKTIITQHAEGNIDEDSLNDYHLRIKRSMKMDAFEKVLSKKDFNNLVLADRTVNIAYLLSLFGFIEDNFHDLDGLNVVINRLLMNQHVENHYILNCIDFAVILKGLNCKENELPDIDGLRSLLSQAISWMTQEDGKTFNNFLKREGDLWRNTTKAAQQKNKSSNNNNNNNE